MQPVPFGYHFFLYFIEKDLIDESFTHALLVPYFQFIIIVIPFVVILY